MRQSHSGKHLNFYYLQIIKSILICFGLLLFAKEAYTQEDSSQVISGRVLSASSKQALAYASIYILNSETGAISNENGFFSLNSEGLKAKDTVSFKYLGFKEYRISVDDLYSQPNIFLQEKVNTLSELYVFGEPPNPKDIIKKVLEKVEDNYASIAMKAEVFVRERNNQHFKELKIDYKRSSISEINQDLLKKIETKLPRHLTWYTDFLGTAYSLDKDEMTALKMQPKKVVSLEEQDFTESEKIEEIFVDLAKNTKDKEYWKLKTEILSTKIQLSTDSSSEKAEEGERKLTYYTDKLSSSLKFKNFQNEDDWEFLHSPGKYRYTLVGGSSYNNESVYIIDFEAKSGGLYSGRAYISSESYALVRADYKYAPGKLGTDFHLLGVGYSKNGFKASISFEKIGKHYFLKYMSKERGLAYSFDRKLSLLKKRERFLFDKELAEIKTKLNISVTEHNSIEYLVMNQKKISEANFDKFEQAEFMKVIYVDQFDDKLWRGFTIIPPTKQMKEYKKE